jgi:hypothetical protein
MLREPNPGPLEYELVVVSYTRTDGRTNESTINKEKNATKIESHCESVQKSVATSRLKNLQSKLSLVGY